MLRTQKNQAAPDGFRATVLRSVPRRRGTLIALAALGLLAGCETNGPHSVVVGAVPDDYRTNHPIMIGEKEQVLDLPVGASERGMTGLQRTRLDGFLAEYDRGAAPVLTIMAPVGAVNEVAASYAARDFAHRAKMVGVPPSRVAMASYRAESSETSPPVRVTFTAIRAYTDKCGRWPEDIGDTTDNKHWANFGCSVQNNMAAQVANPSDLLGPRRRGEIDAENRQRAIDAYQRREITGEFLDQSEVNY